MSLGSLRPDVSDFLSPYLPPNNDENLSRPSVTLTYAQSLDSRISKGHGIRTTISHPETKTMTHYLRYHHDGILIGSGTALADNPGLNCKYGGPDAREHSPRPIILDAKQKWKFSGSKMQELFLSGEGKSPIIVVDKEPADKETGAEYLACSCTDLGSFDWDKMMHILRTRYRIKSVMVEGGANVINQLILRPDLVDNLVITIGPTFLGRNGVEVSPTTGMSLCDVNWWRGTNDAVLAAHLSK
ncbi:hypothetical protein HG535_0H03130 [Zygotorulaspora mrakii]|uniref:2,5-diamino-6-ribosylamino-4(3H)-pyrimidinone 5'-phosphate reductase n=1 Tax=Zygotorulaspora mrakii TaxID=42260 RepID=A0A7H9B9D2_ZYGMR|nr:uncharacterized protein HG535_0H03130 [Zygotorulaspora mrakii]QLG74986.1 hypothetical protein HG535_0H03130 [Zygotorulaspora mrakii]